MKYLTQLLNKRVLQPDGSVIGRTLDAMASLTSRLPPVTAVVVGTSLREVCVPYASLELDLDPLGVSGSGAIQGDIRLKRPLDAIEEYRAGDEDLRLRRDVLDKQIVDVQDHRVVRVCDVRLAACGNQFCVVGVDASLRATLRQLGLFGRLIESVARLVGRPLRSNLIAWDDVQTLEPGTAGGRIRLKVSHDKIARLHPADIADIVEQLSPQKGAEVMENLDTETAAEAMAEAEPDVQVQIIQHLDDATASDIVEQMEPDEAADLLNDLPDHRSDELLKQMEPEEARDVKELMAYDEDSAGGLMTTELVSISADLTCDETIQRLRELAPKAETVYYVYVVDAEERLVGVLSLRDLVIARPSTRVSEIMVRNVIHVYVEDHADEVAQILGRYNLLAVPVVSEDERLVGIITVDDTLERLLPPERRRRLPVPALAGHGDDE